MQSLAVNQKLARKFVIYCSEILKILLYKAGIDPAEMFGGAGES